MLNADELRGGQGMKRLLENFLLATFLLSSCSVEQTDRASRLAATNAAIATGEVNTVLSATEAKALEAERKQNWGLASEFYHDAALAARASGQLQKAISYGHKSFETAEKAKDPMQQVRAIFRLFQSLSAVGQEGKAFEWLQRGSEILKQVPAGGSKEIDEGRLYRFLGSHFLRQGETQKAIEHLSYSLQVLDSRLSYLQRIRANLSPTVIPNTQHSIILTLNPLGDAYREAGQLEEAIKAYGRAVGMVREARLKEQIEVNLYAGLGETYLKKGDFPRALENLRKALDLAEKNRFAPVIQRASSGIGNVLRQTQKPAEAIPFYQKAIEQTESIRSLLQSEEHRQSYFEGLLPAYVNMITVLSEAGKQKEAFNYGERARSRAFLDLLGNKAQLSRVKSGLLEEEKALQERIASIKAKLSSEEDGEADSAGLRKELSEAEQAYGAFLSKVRKQDKEQASLTSVEPLTLQQVQELLDPGTTLIEYFVTEREIFVWVVEKEKLRFVRVPLPKEELGKLVKTLRESIFALGEKGKFKEVSAALYERLIQPLLPHITGKQLIIVPHDVLHYLPFQALLSGQEKYLIQDYPIYYLSSASLMQFTHEKRRASGERALVMGNPTLGDEAYNLRFAEREAREVARVFPKSEVYVEAEATKSRAISLSPNFEMLHFAVHAELNEEDPINSALLFAAEGKDDGRLKVGEIFLLNLKAGMVVLSACETGLGKLSNGDELIGLTRAFIYAGTPSIITTLWKVNDRASYELMREFYQHLKTAKKVEALRQAQLKVMEQFPEPFYWAAYELTGEP